MLIIMFGGLIDSEKEMDGLHVVYTSKYQMFQKIGMKGRPPSIDGNLDLGVIYHLRCRIESTSSGRCA